MSKFTVQVCNKKGLYQWITLETTYQKLTSAVSTAYSYSENYKRNYENTAYSLRGNYIWRVIDENGTSHYETLPYEPPPETKHNIEFTRKEHNDMITAINMANEMSIDTDYKYRIVRLKQKIQSVFAEKKNV